MCSNDNRLLFRVRKIPCFLWLEWINWICRGLFISISWRSMLGNFKTNVMNLSPCNQRSLTIIFWPGPIYLMWQAIKTFIILWNNNDRWIEALAGVTACFGLPRLKHAPHFDVDFYTKFKEKCQIWVERQSTNRDYFSKINCFSVRLTFKTLFGHNQFYSHISKITNCNIAYLLKFSFCCFANSMAQERPTAPCSQSRWSKTRLS